MAKTTNATLESEAHTVTVSAVTQPRLGEAINVRAGAGRTVPNNAAGDLFSETDTVSVNVDLRILKLLRDGDLLSVAGKK